MKHIASNSTIASAMMIIALSISRGLLMAHLRMQTQAVAAQRRQWIGQCLAGTVGGIRGRGRSWGYLRNILTVKRMPDLTPIHARGMVAALDTSGAIDRQLDTGAVKINTTNGVNVPVDGSHLY